MKRLLVLLAVVAAAIGTLTLAVSAAAAPPKPTLHHPTPPPPPPNTKLAGLYGMFWQAAFDTPTPQNPLTGGDPCVMLGHHVLAPILPAAPVSVTCVVMPGTKVFVNVFGSDCSTVEAPPYFGANEDEMRTCARESVAGFPVHELTVDGHAKPVREVGTPLITLDLPPDNILGVPAQQAFAVAYGWPALLHPLTPGTHHLTMTVNGSALGATFDYTQDVTIIVAKP